jgi:hypothetical protein
MIRSGLKNCLSLKVIPWHEPGVSKIELLPYPNVESITQFEEVGMKKIVSVTLLALLVGGTFALPVQEAVAAAACRYVNGKKVCGATAQTKPKTVCTTTNGVKHCRKVY